MEKSVIGLVAAIGAVTPFAAAHATAVTPEDAANALRVSSVAELLEPVANAPAILAALAASPGERAASADKGVQVAQWYHHHHHHFYHHHHHHFYHHHHHHFWHHHSHWWWCRYHPYSPNCY
ncbi:MAG: hypothetical protein KGM15_14530 [Pseudomonadota bacterium]|nr:hypothetical protein [Pseudomonadota bacterium]